MENRSFSHLFNDLMFNFSALVRSEIRLAAAEAKQNASHAASQGTRAAMYFGIAFFGALAILAFAILALGELLEGRFWLSSLIIGLALAIPGTLLGLRAIRELKVEVDLPVSRSSVLQDQTLLRTKIDQNQRKSS